MQDSNLLPFLRQRNALPIELIALQECSQNSAFRATIQPMKIVNLEDVGVEKAAKLAAKTLSKAGIVLYPTDTIYGLAVDALNTRALEKLRDLKGREKKKPISVIVPDVASIESYAILSEQAKHLASRYLPGPLTLVLPGIDKLPEELMLHGTLGIRVPNHPFTAALSKAFKRPYTATSANRSGLITGSTVREILEQFGSHIPHIDLVIDAGPLSGGIPSTVVSFTGERLNVLREGAISKEELQN
ncbi:MAG: translation factor [Parcubacteria group bacterium]|nr:translation factor [Parcubacteria group bacterium]